jgi:hypothetical protein
MAKNPIPFDIRTINGVIPNMTMMQLHKAFAADCGCGSSCRARTQQVNHGFCFYHEKIYSEMERRRALPPSLRLLRTTAQKDGSCNSCQSREGEMILIELKITSFRLCRACQAELEALLKIKKKARR